MSMSPIVLAGKYEVREEIARGGMGIIYKAFDLRLERDVVIKQVHAHLSGNPFFVERFLREARAMARLQHPNIVPILALEEVHNTPFLVMEFCPGLNIHDLIRSQRHLPVRAIVSVAHQLASALAYAHAHGVIHRDITPANILVDQRNQVKLTDFGIAGALYETSLTTTGQVVGTLEYMSPEQARGDKIDGRSDLFSLGIVMYEMLTRRKAYGESSKTSILHKIAHDQEDLTLQFPSQVPSLVQRVVQNLLRRNPDERIQDAETLATQLHEILYTFPQTSPTAPLEKSEPTVVLPLHPSQADDRTHTIAPRTGAALVTPMSTEHPVQTVLAEAPPRSATHPTPPRDQTELDETTVLVNPPQASPKWWHFWKGRDRHTPPDNQPDQNEPEPVLLGASAPSKVIQGHVFIARFVAYVQAADEKVERMLTSLGHDSSIRVAPRTCRWKLGTDVSVHLSGQYLEVQCPTQTFKWKGGYSLVDFDVGVAGNAPLGTTTLKYDVSIHGVIVARVQLEIEISHLRNSRTVRTASIYPAHTAFASYASEDTLRVLDRVAAVKISAGLNVWVDCLSLNPGEQWKSRLHQEICHRDLFLLFWSRHAKESEWVSWEWHTALKEKGEPALQLHPLETPQVAPPPEELKHLHFGDPIMLARKALEQ